MEANTKRHQEQIITMMMAKTTLRSLSPNLISSDNERVSFTKYDTADRTVIIIM